MNQKFNVAVVGATGMVGQELLSILQERKFPIENLKLLASASSAGKTHDFGAKSLTIEALDPNSLKDIDIAFGAVDTAFAEEIAGWIQNTKTVFIDKSSAFRQDPDIPLVAAEVNPQDIERYSNKNIIACPNCTSTPLVQILAPLDKQFGLKRVVACSYQAVSGSGKPGFEELEKQTRDLFNLREIESKFYPNQIAFNVLPYIAGEEDKLVHESRRILHMPNLNISATCARVPVFNGHSCAVHMDFEKPVTPDEARDLLSQSPGLEVIDNLDKQEYPMPIEASGGDLTLVGRIRQDTFGPNSLAAWYASDNLRTGAALNAVKVAEILIREYLK